VTSVFQEIVLPPEPLISGLACSSLPPKDQS
jgi:hypothetical protein